MMACLVVGLVAGPPLALRAAQILTVTQKGRAFSVREVKIAKGGIVRFDNEDDFLHQVYVKSPRLNFESDEQEPGTVVDIAFPFTGAFEVRCDIHPKMLLKVTVE